MTEQITCHLLKLAGPVGGEEDTACANRLFPLSNYKDSMKSPAATLSGFLGLRVSVTTLLPRCTDGQWAGGEVSDESRKV